jgi:hypothetical protein
MDLNEAGEPNFLRILELPKLVQYGISRKINGFAAERFGSLSLNRQRLFVASTWYPDSRYPSRRLFGAAEVSGGIPKIPVSQRRLAEAGSITASAR